MPKYSLQDLLCGTMLIAFGLAAVCWVFAEKRWIPHEFRVAQEIIAWLAGCSAIGAGAFLPWKRTQFGAALGLIVALILWALVVVLFPQLAFGA